MNVKCVWILGLIGIIIAIIGVGIANAVGYQEERKALYNYSETTTYIVQEGDTLWQITAKRIDKRHDIRKVIYEIEELNNTDANIKEGQKLILPIYNTEKEGK